MTDLAAIKARFNEYFERKCPGMSQDSLTYREEWVTWSSGYMTAVDRYLRLLEGIENGERGNT